MIDKKILIKQEEFFKEYKDSEDLIKKRVHFNSVLNISRELIKIKNKKETLIFKQNLSEYYDVVFESSHPIDKLGSTKNYHSYLLEITLYLMSKSNFKSKSDIERAVLWGVFFDLILYFTGLSKYYLYVPIVSFGFLISAISKRKKAIKENRYFGVEW